MAFNPAPGSRRNRIQIDRAADKAETADRAVRELERQVQELAARFDRLQRAAEAMWFVVKERLASDEPGLRELVGEVERRLEIVDEGEARQCPHCQRPVSQRTGVCIYCGRAVS